VIQSHAPGSVGLFGTSAGGGLTLATVLRTKELRLPLAGALMAGTPWTDPSQTGDTYFTNEFVIPCYSSEPEPALGRISSPVGSNPTVLYLL
jgi:acetyl esterase/lipase